MKKILTLLLIALLIMNVTACGAKSDQEPEPSEKAAEEVLPEEPEEEEEEEEDTSSLTIPQLLIQDCVEAMFVPDMDTVFDLTHPKLMEYSRTQMQLSEEQYDAIIASCNAVMQDSIDELDAMCDDWDIEIQFLSQRPVSARTLANLRNVYALANVNISGGTLYDVRIYAVVDGEKIPLQDATFSCVQILGRWYLDSALTELVPKEELPAEGDLLPTA